MIFWALEQRRKRAREREQADREQEAAEQAREAAIRHQEAVARSKMIASLMAAGLIKPDQDVAGWARENGIELAILPPY